MFYKRILAVGAAVLLSALPAMAQHKGGGGGHSSAGHTGGGHVGGYSGGHNHSSGYHGGYSSGLYLNLGFGGGYGGGYGGSYYRPSYSPGYSGGYYGPVPYQSAPRVVTAPPAVTYSYPNIVNNPATNPTIYPQNPPPASNPIPVGAETGLRITELSEGTAKIAGLRKGDIILKVDGIRTQNFEELRATLSTGKEKVTVEYLDGTSGETDKKNISVQDTRIGVTVIEAVIPRT